MSGVANQGFDYREQIGAQGRGLTVVEYLARRHEHASEAEWRSRVEAGGVEIEGRAALPDERVRPGDWLIWHRPAWVEPEVPLSYEVLYEDADLLAVSKPSGLQTMPGGTFLQHTLLTLVRRYAPDAMPMHRLGRGTSGVVLFARNESAAASLQAAWREHKVRKTYRALAAGRPSMASFSISDRIGPVPHARLGRIFAVAPDGKPATSHVTVAEQRLDDVIVEVLIDTGRPHQIRIHLAAAGHPLVGDPLYAVGGDPRGDALPSDLGYLLHARELAFLHPLTGQELVVTSTPPADLQTARERGQ